MRTRRTASALHQSFVNWLKVQRLIRSPAVESAFRTVPRHLFLPGEPLEKVYSDEAIITKRVNGVGISSASQPTVVATMLEQLQLEPGQRVLEIGAGTGYNAALIAHIVGESGQVIAVDIDEDLVERARNHLAAAGFGRVQVVCADGGLGYSDAAPCDRIVLTVGAWDIAPVWVEQLKPDGLLLLPLQLRGDAQKTIAFKRAGDHLDSVSITDCSFMPLRGAFAGPNRFVWVRPSPALFLSLDDPGLIDGRAAWELLNGPRRDIPTGVRATGMEIWRGLTLWLALREPGSCTVYADAEDAEQGIVPPLFRWGTTSATIGLVAEGGICVLKWPPRRSRAMVPFRDEKPSPLWIRSYGPDDSLAHRLAEQVAAWDAARRPSSDGLRIRAYKAEGDHVQSGGEFIIVKRWTRLVLDWE